MKLVKEHLTDENIILEYDLVKLQKQRLNNMGKNNIKKDNIIDDKQPVEKNNTVINNKKMPNISNKSNYKNYIKNIFKPSEYPTFSDEEEFIDNKTTNQKTPDNKYLSDFIKSQAFLMFKNNNPELFGLSHKLKHFFLNDKSYFNNYLNLNPNDYKTEIKNEYINLEKEYNINKISDKDKYIDINSNNEDIYNVTQKELPHIVTKTEDNIADKEVVGDNIKSYEIPTHKEINNIAADNKENYNIKNKKNLHSEAKDIINKIELYLKDENPLNFK
ncbi:MAG: hypothetical protein RSC92_03555, partial [Clostridia bacterium]